MMGTANFCLWAHPPHWLTLTLRWPPAPSLALTLLLLLALYLSVASRHPLFLVHAMFANNPCEEACWSGERQT